MNQYTDTQVIECARLHSEEAKANNNDNYALWTNNLTDIIHLNSGDVISMHSAMISERGAGQTTSIEIKGVELGPQKTFEFINLSGNEPDSTLVSGFKSIDANLSSQTINIRDDTAVFTISYYINANGHNYIQLPRRYWWNQNASPITDNWVNDNIVNYGRSYFDPFNGSSTETSMNRFMFWDDYYQKSFQQTTALKNNNDRYTIMVRDQTFFSYNASGVFRPPVYLRDPENAIYRTYKELKQIQIEKGFNSPEYIADEITKQLQRPTQDATYQIRNSSDINANPEHPGFPVPIFKTFETETYKAFNCARLVEEDMATLSNEWFSGASLNASGIRYLQNYHIVGCKRPELYETGRLINAKWSSPDNVYEGILGSELRVAWKEDNNVISLNLRYDKEICDKFKAFFDAQDLYPEIFNTFTDPRNLYAGNETINTCRWLHINSTSNASITDAIDYENDAPLGWSGYLNPSSRPSTNGKQYASRLCPILYDPAQKDTFFNSPNNDKGEKTYGCIGRDSEGYIVLYPTPLNGWASQFWNAIMLGANETTEIPQYHRIGFDMHFSAPGVGWILPYAGFSRRQQETNTNSVPLVGTFTARNSDATVMLNYGLQPFRYRTKLYIGADSPKLVWDGTNFGFSGLHTGMNSGNDERTNSPYDVGPGTDLLTAVNNRASDIVYKINPREQMTDWTPTRVPYVDAKIMYFNASQNASESYTARVFNENLEPWLIYDSLFGIFFQDFNLTEAEWEGTIFDRLGFSYNQFNSTTHTRLTRIDYNNLNDLSLITTNSEVSEGDTKIYHQNMFGAPLYSNMLPTTQLFNNVNGSGTIAPQMVYYPEIVQETQSIVIKADRLPTRMIRGYYTIRSNILQEPHFVGGKKDNTLMPIIAICDKINGDGDFYFQSQSSLEFTITKPLRLASISCSIHDPDGSFANTNEQNTILFKIERQKNVTFNVVQEILQGEQQGKKSNL